MTLSHTPRMIQRTSTKVAALGLLAGLSLVGGCARPWEIGSDPGYTAEERGRAIARNWDYEGKQLVEDVDRALLLRPASRLTRWNMR